jgi:hypothetical protein
MQKTCRCEFSEQQQWLRLDNGTHEANTHGFVTIFNHCTDIEFKVFEAFTNRLKKKKMTTERLLKDAKEVVAFWNALLEYGIDIEFNGAIAKPVY